MQRNIEPITGNLLKVGDPTSPGKNLGPINSTGVFRDNYRHCQTNDTPTRKERATTPKSNNKVNEQDISY